MIPCVSVFMSVWMPGSMRMCVWCRESLISHVKHRSGSFLSWLFYLWATVENIIVFAELRIWVYQFSTIYIDTTRDALAGKIYGRMKYGLVHSEKVLNTILWWDGDRAKVTFQ